MINSILLILCLVVFTNAVIDFKASFVMRNNEMKGYAGGEIFYDASHQRYLLHFKRSNYQELYTYAEDGSDGWVHKTGAGCNECDSQSLASSFPLYNSDVTRTSDFKLKGSDEDGCQVYEAVSSNNALVALHIKETRPCRAIHRDGTDLRFSSIHHRTFEADDPMFALSPDCRCGNPLDIAIAFDRSSSISPEEWLEVKGFLHQFSSVFNYGILSTGLAFSNFNDKIWTTMDFDQGNSWTSIETIIDSYSCSTSNPCHGNGKTECCRGYTCLSCGMRVGANQLSQTTRPEIPKVLIIITDGCHNTKYSDVIWNGQKTTDHCDMANPGTPQGEFKQICQDDLIATYSNITTLVPNLSVFVIAIGEQFCTEDLVLIAGGKEERVLTAESFATIHSTLLELTQMTCSAGDSACGKCCGLCTCSICSQVDGCDDPINECSYSSLGDTCCATHSNASSCISSDPCFKPICDSNTGCGEVPSCTDTYCATYKCVHSNTSAGYSCVPQLKPIEGCSLTPCQVAEDCEAEGDKCKTYLCHDNSCVYTPKVCSSDNKCVTTQCLPDIGCLETPLEESACDDGDLCTTDTCDPTLGCVHVDVTCSDKDSCTEDLCLPNYGCIYHPIECPSSKDTCAVGFCHEGTCLNQTLNCTLSKSTATIGGEQLGVGAIIGIIIGAALFVAAVAGGAYAISRQVNEQEEEQVNNNPLYEAQGTEINNPLT